jgi:2-polyprenyl-3-methyl-5-hydroxy-6-metoxy-1,4-benzoquinol methylase
MNGSDREHWDRVYGNKGEFQVSWFQDDPALSLELIRSAAPSLESAIIDIGGGAARLVDALLAHDYRDVTVLDLSEAAIGISQARLGGRAERVRG